MHSFTEDTSLWPHQRQDIRYFIENLRKEYPDKAIFNALQDNEKQLISENLNVKPDNIFYDGVEHSIEIFVQSLMFPGDSLSELYTLLSKITNSISDAIIVFSLRNCTSQPAIVRLESDLIYREFKSELLDHYDHSEPALVLSKARDLQRRAAEKIWELKLPRSAGAPSVNGNLCNFVGMLRNNASAAGGSISLFSKEDLDDVDKAGPPFFRFVNAALKISINRGEFVIKHRREISATDRPAIKAELMRLTKLSRSSLNDVMRVERERRKNALVAERLLGSVVT